MHMQLQCEHASRCPPALMIFIVATVGTWPATWGALPALQDLIVHSMRGLTGDLSKIALPANIGKLDLDSIPKLTGEPASVF